MNESTLKSYKLNRLQKLKQKVRLISVDISFLKRCKKHKLFPNFIKVKTSVFNNVTKKVIHNAKINWLNLEIKSLYAKQTDLELQAYEMHLEITKSLNNYDFMYFQERYLAMLDSIECKLTHKVENLNKKFITLQEFSNNKENINSTRDIGSNEELVKNLSTATFTEPEINLLSKGLNFSIEPLKEKELLFIDIESNLKYENNNVKTKIKTDIFEAIQNTNLLNKAKVNNNKTYTNIIKSLKEKDVFYLKADKSNTVVILDKKEYYERVENMLKHPPYKVINKNPLSKYITSVSTSLKNCKNVISNDHKRKLTVPNPNLPRLYCLPKIHKDGKQMRPIVSCVNAPSYNISKWLLHEFQKLEFPETFSIKDRYQFIEATKDLNIEPHEMLVSFDVVALYPNVPMKETSKILENWLQTLDLPEHIIEELMILYKLCISQNAFQFKDTIYNQEEGTPMGDPISCFIANLFMSKFETNAKKVMRYFPRVWIRYIDDIFAIFDRDENIQQFVNELNSFYPSIKFTVEIENNHCLPFLDLLLSRNITSRKMEYNIFRKATCNNRYIMNDSFHHPSHKRAVFHSLVHRLMNTPLSTENYNLEVKKIKEIAVFNGYNHKLVDDMIYKKQKKMKKNARTTLLANQSVKVEKWKSMSYTKHSKGIAKSFKKHANVNISFTSKCSLKSLLGNPKSKIEDLEKSGIYEIPCNDCPKKYIGQTKRKIKTRMKEHQLHLRNGRTENSAMAKHAVESDHSFTKINLLKEVNKEAHLDAYETIFIKKNETNLVNNEPGLFQNSPFLYF